MSEQSLLDSVRTRLLNAGYVDLPSRVRVAGVEFVFTGSMRGSHGRSLDLVLLFDTTGGDFGDRIADRVRQRVEAFSRALDVTGSRYVVTAVLVGASFGSSISALSETCRVLYVDNTLPKLGVNDSEFDRVLDDCIRVLLPLTLPNRTESIEESSAVEQLLASLPSQSGSKLLKASLAAASIGEQAVTDTVAQIIMTSFSKQSAEDQ